MSNIVFSKKYTALRVWCNCMFLFVFCLFAPLTPKFHWFSFVFLIFSCVWFFVCLFDKFFPKRGTVAQSAKAIPLRNIWNIVRFGRSIRTSKQWDARLSKSISKKKQKLKECNLSGILTVQVWSFCSPNLARQLSEEKKTQNTNWLIFSIHSNSVSFTLQFVKCFVVFLFTGYEYQKTFADLRILRTDKKRKKEKKTKKQQPIGL